MGKKDREEHFSEKEALVFHAQGKPGKIEIKATKPLETQRDLSLAYSPGVAAPVNAIADDISSVYDYTCLLYTSPSPRDIRRSRMPSSA